jgi:lipopolysaccharide export system protein LptA
MQTNKRRFSAGPCLAALVTIVPIVFFALVGGASAQQPALGSSHDTSQPIEITADTLEVRQTENIAIFRGEVDAIQGDMLLRADMLVVYYRETEENKDDLGISRIDAEGNVFISSPEETAQGKRGVYDVDNGRIDLAGDVVLTQGENIIQGDTLQMDLNTGKSRVISEGETGKDRVRGLFVPQKKNK